MDTIFTVLDAINNVGRLDAYRYPVQRLDAACERGLVLHFNQLKRIRSLLDSNLDQLPLDLPAATAPRQDHENLRDPASFH